MSITAPALYDLTRLRAVQTSGLLDSGPEEPFDRLAALAAKVLKAPFAFVTAVDTRRSWFKSCIGLPADAPRQTPVEESFCQYVIASGGPVIVADTRLDPRTCDNPAIESMGVIAWAGFPITGVHDEIIGTFCVCDTVPHAWTADDIEVLDTLAQAATREIALRESLGEERRARKRLETLARTLQATLLPPHLPEVPGIDVAARYLSAGAGDQVMGDFYDLFQHAPQNWALVMGDVCGKGPNAATLTALARYTLRAAALQTDSPAGVLQVLNQAMLQQQPDEERFITLVYANLALSDHGVAMSVSSAGHVPPLLRHADGTVDVIAEGDELRGAPLGLFPDPGLCDISMALEPGDTLLLVTDGITEARRGSELFGFERLIATVEQTSGLTATATVAAVQDAVADFHPGPALDDSAVLAVRVSP